MRDISGEPVSIEESYVPLDLIAKLDQIDISLYTYFRCHGIAPVRTQSWVSAQQPTPEFITHVKTASALPMLVVKALAFDAQYRPIDYSINYCRSDIYVFYSEE